MAYDLRENERKLAKLRLYDWVRHLVADFDLSRGAGVGRSSRMECSRRTALEEGKGSEAREGHLRTPRRISSTVRIKRSHQATQRTFLSKAQVPTEYPDRSTVHLGAGIPESVLAIDAPTFDVNVRPHPSIPHTSIGYATHPVPQESDPFS